MEFQLMPFYIDDYLLQILNLFSKSGLLLCIYTKGQVYLVHLTLIHRSHHIFETASKDFVRISPCMPFAVLEAELFITLQHAVILRRQTGLLNKFV